MHKRKFVRAVALVSALSLVLATGALAAVLGDPISDRDTYLGAGMELSKGVYWTGSDYQTENYIEYSRDSSVYPVMVSGSKVCNYGNFSSMAALLEKQGKHVIAGINGDYYVVANYEPLGIEVVNGELWSSDAGHWAVGFTSDGSTVFGKPTLSISADIGGQDFTLDAVNKTRRDGGAVFYTDDYSPATKNTGDGTDIICSISAPLGLNCEVTLTVEDIVTTGGAVTIPAGKTILSVSANATEGLLTAIGGLEVGSTMTLDVSSPPEWADVTYAIGSLYKLVTDGAVESGLPASDLNPRTAIGEKADGSLVFYTIDGKQSGYSVGVTIAALAQRMLELGCVEATIMDGGGSTSMNAIYLGDSSVSQINDPSDGYQRSVSSYIMLVTDAQPTGTATRLALYPLSADVLKGATTTFTPKAADDNGYAADVPSYVNLSVTGGVGTITSDGTFTATAAGSGSVTAAASGLTGASVQVNVVETPDTIKIKNEASGASLSSLSVATESTVSLTAAALKNHVSLISQDGCYEWSAESVQGDVGTISADGTFTAGDKDAVGTITVKAGNMSVSIPVTVINPDKFDDAASGDWFYDAAQYVGENGIMNGTADRVFSPDTEMSRAMAVTVLWRMEGSPEPDDTGSFSDVPEDQWYYKAVYWAAEQGIVQGYDGKFDPDSPVTREQLAAMLYRWSGSPETTGTLDAFTDADSVSSWAGDALSWAVGQELISGVTDTTISPQTTATRAQFATILYRMSK